MDDVRAVVMDGVEHLEAVAQLQVEASEGVGVWQIPREPLHGRDEHRPQGCLVQGEHVGRAVVAVQDDAHARLVVEHEHVSVEGSSEAVDSCHGSSMRWRKSLTNEPI
ncbi:hypothetical protein HY630_00520 [Candidatus Uhrbacteria bacterium]|nr:hypothetical protein [Candidatus Uhrbacteria bacterium]